MFCPFLLLFFAGIGFVCGRVQSSVPQCRGVFDFYFVLDSSGSVGGHFGTEFIPFVQNVTVNFVNPNFRLSFITFADKGVVHLNLTSDRQQIAKGIINLQNHPVGGLTSLATGLQKVNEQINRLGGDTASVILILTDGIISDDAEANKQAQIARQKGASIFAIEVGNDDRQQLRALVQNDNELFICSDFQYLTSIINQVINDTCIEIISADLVNVCINQDGLTTTLTGQGFTHIPNPNMTACRFLFNETEFQITSTVGDISYDKITCSVPQFNKRQQVLLQVTLNGISYISSNVTMYVNDCTTKVINDTCIEIISADPVNVCINQDGLTTTLTGQGFTNTPNPNMTACRFLFNETEFQITSTVGDISYDKITCSVPQFNKRQCVFDTSRFSVTLNGISFISSNVTMYVNDCTTKPVNAGLVAGLTFGLLGLIILIVLLLIWFFFPLLTGKTLSTPEPEPEPEPEQLEENPGPKKWATVDASYYGGRGAGGIRPLPVYWGDKGATKKGNKLTATKDANIIEMGEDVESSSSSRPSRPSRLLRPYRPPRTKNCKSSCISTSWRYVKETASSFYSKLSLIRPVRGADRTIIWFPFRQQDTVANQYKTPSRQIRSKLETTRTTLITELKSTQQNSTLSKTDNSSRLPPNMRSNIISSNREPPSRPLRTSKANTLSSVREPFLRPSPKSANTISYDRKPPSHLKINTPSSGREPPSCPPSLKSKTLSSGKEPSPHPTLLRSNTVSSGTEPPPCPTTLRSNTLSSGRVPRPTPRRANTLSNTNA